MNNGWTGGQYSIFRVLLGSYLIVQFIGLMPWALGVLSSAGMLGDAGLSPYIDVFPNILAIWDTPLTLGILLITASIAALFLAMGSYDRAATLWLIYTLACLFGRNPLIANPALPYVGWLLLIHALLPKAAYGSIAAIGRPDPAGEWRMPREVFVAAWIVLAVTYSYSGYAKLLSPSWLNGETVTRVLQNPPVTDTWLGEFSLSLPAFLFAGLKWAILVVELLFAPLALIRRLRPWLWSIMLLVQFCFLVFLNIADVAIPMLLMHFMTFDPAWIRRVPVDKSETIFYDGHCGLCHRAVRFVLAEDNGDAFRFAPLQSDLFVNNIKLESGDEAASSMRVLTQDDTLLNKSDAVIHVLQRLGGLWRMFAHVFGVLPKRFRDGCYDLVGRNRYRLFARQEAMCPICPPHLKERFTE